MTRRQSFFGPANTFAAMVARRRRRKAPTPSRYQPHQGKRECARRLRQLAKTERQQNLTEALR